MRICYAALIFAFLLIPPVMVAQLARVLPTWEMQVDSAKRVDHHASVGLISVQSTDSVTFYDVETGQAVATRLLQGELRFVDSTRALLIWTKLEGEKVSISRSRFTDDSATVPIWEFNFGVTEQRPYGWKSFSSSAANLSFLYQVSSPHNWTTETVQADVLIGSVSSDTFSLSMRSSAFGRVGISRSGKLFGGNDSGVTIENPMTPKWKVIYSWDHIQFNGLDDYRYIFLKKQRQAWLDDIDDILIATDGLYKLIPIGIEHQDSAVFLHRLPAGWYWHAPFADWTYALACKSDSTQVSIVSLVTDSVVAECTPTSRRIDTIYSDVQRNYIITYDAAARVLSGFIVDTALIPRQVISAVEDDPEGDVVGQGAQSKGLVWPNPARELAHVCVLVGTTHITITSVLGVTYEFAVLPGSEVVDIPLLNFANGVYVVNIRGTSIRQILHIQR